MLPVKRGQKFELKLEDEEQINFKHSAHYTLSWIACVDNHCNIHHVLKAKHNRYPKRMEWNDSEKKFWDAKVIYKWHPSAVQDLRYLSIKPKRFITEECLSGHQ